MKYIITQDDYDNWYVIPKDMHKEWIMMTINAYAYGDTMTMPPWAKQISKPESVSFDEYEND